MSFLLSLKYYIMYGNKFCSYSIIEVIESITVTSVLYGYHNLLTLKFEELSKCQLCLHWWYHRFVPCDKVGIMTSFTFQSNMPPNSNSWSTNQPSDAGDKIFWFIWSLPSLLMPWLLNFPGHQQTWYWNNRVGNICSCSTGNLVVFCWTKSKIWYEMWIYVQ